MAPRKLQRALGDLSRGMRESRRLAKDAHQWSSGAGKKGRPDISEKTRDSIVEMAFLRAFLAWEAFLAESFILYLLGQIPPRGRAPKRYYFPPNREMAEDWLAEGKDYAKWHNASEVATRASRLFRDGHPFTAVLRSSQARLSDATTIRNMIAHRSASAKSKFEAIVRRELGSLPLNSTAGAFLGTTAPRTVPPVSFLELYIDSFENCAQQITPPP